MSADIKKLYPRDAAKNPDNVLEQAVGVYDEVIIMGHNKDGEFDIRASTNIAQKDLLWMTQLFIHKLMNGDYWVDEE
jgi:hypothetical protein